MSEEWYAKYEPKGEGQYRGTVEYFLVYCALINAAKNRGTITYQDVAQIMGLPPSGSHMGRETGFMVGAISRDEHHYGRPMLSAICVNVKGMPGEGFFVLAKELGKLQDDSEEGRRRFWEEEKQAVYKTWHKKTR